VEGKNLIDSAWQAGKEHSKHLLAFPLFLNGSLNENIMKQQAKEIYEREIGFAGETTSLV